MHRHFYGSREGGGLFGRDFGCEHDHSAGDFIAGFEILGVALNEP